MKPYRIYEARFAPEFPTAAPFVIMRWFDDDVWRCITAGDSLETITKEFADGRLGDEGVDEQGRQYIELIPGFFDAPQPRGGARAGAGRKVSKWGPLERKDVRLTPEMIRFCTTIGDGDFSEGVRLVLAEVMGTDA